MRRGGAPWRGGHLRRHPARMHASIHIVDGDRRTFAGMLGALDEGVANITNALSARAMIQDTILLFSTDNGAPDSHFGGTAMSNWPLRGGKGRRLAGRARSAET